MRWAPLFALGCAASTPEAAPEPGVADVQQVEVSGNTGAYTFAVTVRSDDVDCSAFADWWEVLRADGSLAFRRILRHSHATEQPFRRGGAPIPVGADEELWVRAHFADAQGGRFGQARTGTAASGFRAGSPPEGFGASTLTQEPLPGDCLF